MLANYLNERQTAGEKPSWRWNEKPLSSCAKRILKITQKPIADAENTARKTVPKTRFLGDSSRDRKAIACAIWSCLGAIILSQPASATICMWASNCFPRKLPPSRATSLYCSFERTSTTHYSLTFRLKFSFTLANRLKLIALTGWQKRTTFYSSKRPSRLRKPERQIQSERKFLAKSQ
jgi:hypothetical protein